MADGHPHDDALSLRSPPHNFECEVQILGAILASTNNRAFDMVADILRPDHFMDPRHARIYEACEKLVRRGQNATAVTLKNYFEQDATLTEIGGPAYLGKLAAAAVTIINARQHAEIIADLWRRRQLIDAGEDLVNAAYAHDLETTAEIIASDAAAKIDQVISTAQLGADGPMLLGEVYRSAITKADAAFKSDSKVAGLSTGLVDLDKRLGGLQPGDFIIIAARPGQGKTALGWGIAKHNARQFQQAADEGGKMQRVRGGRVAFFSLEMSRDQIAQRDLAAEIEKSVQAIRTGNIEFQHFQYMQEFADRYADVPLWLDDTPNLTLNQIRHRARRLHRSKGLDLLVVDYLQLVTIDRNRSERHHENREREVAAISRGFKGLAKELGIPVICLCQLSRKVEEREDKRPMGSDLRESGSLEQDADVILFIYRQAVYWRQQKPRRRSNETEAKFNQRYAEWSDEMAKIANLAEIILEKNRQGQAGVSVDVHWNGQKTTFSDLARQDSLPVHSINPND